MREAIILAGGLGKRLRKFVDDVPKPMAPINGEPFLNILIKNLSKKGFNRIVLCVGYKSEKIISYFGNQFNSIEIIYSIEKEDELLGTGGAIKKAMQLCISNKIYIFNGDTFLDIEIEKIEEQFKLNKKNIIVSKYQSDLSRYGKLIIENENLKGFKEKGASGDGYINAGCYLFKKEIINHFPIQSSFSFEEEFISKKLKELQIEVFSSNSLFIDIGIPSDYELAQNVLLKYQK